MVVAGMLDIIASAGCLFLTIFAFISPPWPAKRWTGDFWSYVIIFLVLALLALAGGIQALRRKMRRLVLAVSGLFMLFAPFLGIPATILAAISDGESPTKEQGFTDLEKATTQKTSWAWWLLPIFLFWLGGLAGYFAVRNKNKPKAKNLLLLGILIFVGLPLSLIPLLGMWL